MTREIVRLERETFLNVKVVGSDRTFAGLDLVRCEFTGSNLAQFDDPGLGLVVRDVTAQRCVVKWSGAAGVRFENVLVDGLTTSRPVFLSGCAFRHVTLRGPIGEVLATPPEPSLDAAVQQAFEDAIVRYYGDVDWALDISEASFMSAGLYYVPGHLIRRDPETQYLLRRVSFEGLELGSLPLRARIAIQRFESTPFDSIVAVAPKRHKDFHETKEALDELRARGLAT